MGNGIGGAAAAALGVCACAALAFAGWNLWPLFEKEEPPAQQPPAYETTLTLYEGPKTMTSSRYARIAVNGNDLFVYDAVVNPARENRGDYNVSSLTTTPMAYFDFGGGAADVRIFLPDANDIDAIERVTVSPLALEIEPAIDERVVQFTIDQPGFYTVQFNGSPKGAVHLFANPLETDIPDRADENVIWIEPGEWNIENIALQTGQTLYISGGAVVHGTVSAQFASNIEIRGRGIIDGSNWPSWGGNEAHVPMDLRYCTNVRAEGIIFHNSNAWVFNCFETERAVIENVKIISARPNGDGFTLQSCRNVTVRNCFARTWDDSCVVKNYEGNTRDITFRDVTIWTDLAQSCEIGYETNKGKKANAKISNVLFENITVVNAFHKPVLSIHNSDDALVENVTYRNVVVEDAAMGMGDAGENRQLIDLTIAPSTWNSTKTRGQIRDIHFEDITVLAGAQPPTVRVAGYDDEHDIQNVSIKNLTVFGERIDSVENLRLSKKFASGIVVE